MKKLYYIWTIFTYFYIILYYKCFLVINTVGFETRDIHHHIRILNIFMRQELQG